ncbi:topoisomerase [Candidatus Methylomirabilis sp.]|uniref:topoisomerase n=1 Tax=Candidatus Methylomirabilis sp. TaxID=2032687 RepID=UPI0030764F93
MAKRDPEKTARNRVINGLTGQLRDLLPDVLSETGISSEHSLHGIYGGKFADYIDIKNEVIQSPEHFIALYLEGLQKKAAVSGPAASHPQNLELLLRSPTLQEYLFTFLKRTYLRNLEALSKKRPSVEEAAVWIGQNNADYGLLITPRFNPRKGQWENDKSEIRHFAPLYWSIGHVLETGLVIPRRDERITFRSSEEYLDFFLNVLVRNSGSKYEYALANTYRDYVLSTPEPHRVPLLIPEFRYEGMSASHKYRLDFTIIDPLELTKIGFELSPWSSHGYLSKVKGLTQAEINSMAQNNFEREMRKHKDFFRKHGIFVLIYTDSDLANLTQVFADMKKYLEPKSRRIQLRFHIIHDILGRRI